MLNAVEVESVMGSGEHGGVQRWQLTIIHLSYNVKESCVNFNECVREYLLLKELIILKIILQF